MELDLKASTLRTSFYSIRGAIQSPKDKKVMSDGGRSLANKETGLAHFIG